MSSNTPNLRQQIREELEEYAHIRYESDGSEALGEDKFGGNFKLHPTLDTIMSLLDSEISKREREVREDELNLLAKEAIANDSVMLNVPVYHATRLEELKAGEK